MENQANTWSKVSNSTSETSSSHLSAGSTEGPPPGVALLRRGHILVHVFLQQTAARLASRPKTIEAWSSGGAFTHLSKLVSDVLPCFSAPLFDLPFKLLVEGQKNAAVSVDSQVNPQWPRRHVDSPAGRPWGGSSGRSWHPSPPGWRCRPRLLWPWSCWRWWRRRAWSTRWCSVWNVDAGGFTIWDY